MKNNTQLIPMSGSDVDINELGQTELLPFFRTTTTRNYSAITPNVIKNRFNGLDCAQNFRPVLEKCQELLHALCENKKSSILYDATLKVAKDDAKFGVLIEAETSNDLNSKIKRTLKGPKLQYGK